MELFTIGHSNYSIERLIHMLKHFKIDCVVDVRKIPYSKYNVQFDKERLMYTLRKEGFIYIYMANELGAKRDNKESYNEEGYSDFEKVINEEAFIRGIDRLIDGCNKNFKIAVLGAMQEPIRCHRAILIGRELNKRGVKVNHILDDYSIIGQEDIENRLLDKYFKDRNQITIDSLLGTGMSEKDMIDEGYRLANKEIGYRIEKLKERKK
ncbi:Uncharacterized conserved protein [Clostridium baratii]|uniref:DUF488 domain-containing protein n=1 Tax=Clostridium baratii TaxID=1561 RepID=UPI0005F2E8F3|nr:DUF488 domain-containing protein [Clostridium baratii]KJU72661.1 hypothetical protein UC77_01370 [Clostridium baratii]CUP26440.1 Uncharacterized conserved protein [Clostridium baratii]